MSSQGLPEKQEDVSPWVKGAVWSLWVAIVIIGSISGLLYRSVTSGYDNQFDAIEADRGRERAFFERKFDDASRDRDGLRAILDALIPQCAATISRVDRNSADILKIQSTDDLLGQRISSMQADVIEHRKQNFGEKIEKLSDRQGACLERIHQLELRINSHDSAGRKQ